jgi:ABC-2 type transport system permease protein
VTNNRPSQLRAYLSMSWYTLKATLRNPATIAFGLAFPVVFIAIFGLIGNSGQNLTLGIPQESDRNNPVVATLKNLSFVKVDESDRQTLENKLRQGKVDGVLEVTTQGNPPHYGATLTTTSGNPTGAGTAQTIVAGIVDKLNLQLSGVTSPPIALSVKEVSGRQFRYIDFVLPGQIGFSLLSTAMFSTVFGFIALKRLLVFKRMFATPVRALTILLAQGTSRLVMSLIQTLVILAVGVLAFNFNLPHGWQTFGEVLVLVVIGLVAFLGFGIFASGFASNENTAGPIVNLVTLPQFLISGVFFPVESLPTWIQPVANNLPLSYFNHAIRTVTTDGGTLLQTLPYVGGLMLWGLAMYLLAARTFKWE